MATKTFYASSNLVSVHQEMTETAPGSNAFLSPVTGWVVGTAITNRSKLNSQVESSTFDSATYPNGTIDTTIGDCFRSTNTYTGSFAATAWAFRLPVASNTVVAGAGRAYFRLFRGTNADGSGATEITSSALQGSTLNPLGLGVINVQSSGIFTFNPGVVTLTAEYLFVQIAWERTVAGGMSTSDVNIVAHITNGILATPDFTPAATVFTQSLTATLSPTAALIKKITDAGFTAALSFIGNLAATKLGQLFLKSFTATLFPSGGDFPTTNLISYWKLDEASGTRVDSHGSNHLTDNNTVGSTTGIISNAAVFVRANSEYLSCASNSTLQMSGNTSFTISAWIKATVSVSTTQSIITKDDDAANSRDYTIDISGGNARFYIKGGATYIVTSTSGTVGTIYFIVAWYDSSDGKVYLRVNDTSTLSSPGGATGTDVSSAEFRIGAREYAGFEDYADVVVDEVGIWKRVLTASEITALYNGGAGLPYTPGGAPSGTISLKTLKALAAGLSFAAALSRRIAKAFTATSSRSAVLTKKFIDSAFTATLVFVGNLARSRFAVRALTATLSFTGAFSRRTGKVISAELDFVAALIKTIRDRITATLSFVGNLATTFISGGELLFQSLNATFSPTAALSRKVMDGGFTATLSFLGATTKSLRDSFTATRSHAGAITKRIVDGGFGAMLSFAGFLAQSKSLLKAFVATLNFSGFLSSSKSLLKALSATLSFSGTLRPRTSKIFAATLSYAATLTRFLSKRITATLSWIGNLVATFIPPGPQVFSKAFTATLALNAALVRRVARSFAAALAFIGNLATTIAHFFTRSFTATVSFAGNLVRIKLLVRAFSATLTTAGSIRRRTGKAFAATLAFSALIGKAIRKGLAATVSFVGFLFRGGAVTVIAGMITGALVRIGIAGSTARIGRAGSDLEVLGVQSDTTIPRTGSTLRVERTE